MKPKASSELEQISGVGKLRTDKYFIADADSRYAADIREQSPLNQKGYS